MFLLKRQQRKRLSLRLGEVLAAALILAGAAVWNGCATSGWQAEEIPYPRSTPFDSDEFARTAYLDGFRSGYRAELAGDPTMVDMFTGPYPRARRMGFLAGVSFARGEKSASAEESGEKP